MLRRRNGWYLKTHYYKNSEKILSVKKLIYFIIVFQYIQIYFTFYLTMKFSISVYFLAKKIIIVNY